MPPEPNLGQQYSFCSHHPWAKTSLQAWRIFCQVANATLRQTLRFIIGPNTGSYGLPRWEFLDNVHPKSHVIPWTQPLKNQASLHTCTLTRFFNPHMWSMSRCRFTHLTRSGGGHAVRTFLYWFHCHFSRETWIQQVCKIETNSAQPRSSRRNVNPLLERQDRFWMRNVRQCLGPWTCVS